MAARGFATLGPVRVALKAFIWTAACLCIANAADVTAIRVSPNGHYFLDGNGATCSAGGAAFAPDGDNRTRPRSLRPVGRASVWYAREEAMAVRPLGITSWPIPFSKGVRVCPGSHARPY
jgi:hypothetical protein